MATAKTLQGTVKPFAAFNAEQDVTTIRNACKGAGTNEKTLTSILANRSNAQRLEIKQKFKTLVGKDIEDELCGELSGNYRQLVLALFQHPIAYDAQELHRAIQGIGTHEEALVEILSTRSNSEIAQIKAAYKLQFKNDLEHDLAGDTSGHFKRLLVALSTGNRSEDPAVHADKVQQDAQALFKAGEQKLGTDESAFNQVLCTRSREHIVALIAEYAKISKLGLEKAIESEMSGDLKKGMLSVIHALVNKQKFFADRLHWSMKGLGTDDNTLIRIVVSRCETDMVQIKEEFHRHYGKSLESFIEGDTSGDYKNMLLALVGAPAKK